MDNLDIQGSLKKVDRKFTEQLTGQERQQVIRQFKKLYAEQMSKLAGQLSRKAKVQENLYHLNQKERQDAREIDQELKKKMDKHNQNREKMQEGKLKEKKMMEQNWKRKFQEIARKNRAKEREAYHKAEKMRKEVEQYWHKKSQTVHVKESEVRAERQKLSKPFTSLARQHKNPHLDGYSNNKTQYAQAQSQKKAAFNLPEVTKTKINKVDFGNNKYLNKSVAESTLNDEIRSHQEKCTKGAQQIEADKFQKYMAKLQKIQKTRKTAHDKIEKEVKQAKRLRQLKQNPETLAANRKRSIEQLKSKSKSKKREVARENLSNSRSLSKSNLDASIYQHLESKKRLQEQQFVNRQVAYEHTKQKMKQTKINRLIKDAINMLKHQTLHEGTD